MMRLQKHMAFFVLAFGLSLIWAVTAAWSPTSANAQTDRLNERSFDPSNPGLIYPDPKPLSEKLESQSDQVKRKNCDRDFTDGNGFRARTCADERTDVYCEQLRDGQQLYVLCSPR